MLKSDALAADAPGFLVSLYWESGSKFEVALGVLSPLSSKSAALFVFSPRTIGSVASVFGTWLFSSGRRKAGDLAWLLGLPCAKVFRLSGSEVTLSLMPVLRPVRVPACKP